MAGVSLQDIDLCQIYDCYTYTVLVTLEDYGFCKKGEGGSFVEDGKLGPGGSLPTNTGGGQLSAYYMWGMTPISEDVVQVPSQAGERQVKKHDLCLVTGNGGTIAYHSTLYHPGFADEIPYNVAVVDLDEGVRCISNVVGWPNSELRVGMRLEVTFVDVNEEVTVPKFKPAAS